MVSLLRIPLIHRYILREVIVPFFASLTILTAVLFLLRSLRLVELVINRNVPISDILTLFLYLVPEFLELAIPMSLLIGVVLAFGRLSADSELVAMRSCAMRLRRLSTPVVFLACMACLACLGISLWLRPWASYQLAVSVFEMAKSQAGAGLVGGAFNELGQMTIYAEVVERGGQDLGNVLIADQREEGKERIFIAKQGHIVSDQQTRTISLQLLSGSIHEGWGGSYNVTWYDVNNLALSQDELLGSEASIRERKSKELVVQDLLTNIALLSDKDKALGRADLMDLQSMQVELHRRIALPLSCLCVVFLAIALGVQPSRGSNSWGTGASISLGVFAIITYYLGIAFASALGEQGVLPPWILCWLPNCVFAAISYYAFRQVEQERWLAISQVVGQGAQDLLKAGLKYAKSISWRV